MERLTQSLLPIIGTDKILAVLPLGTFNLFARRIGIPLELDAAIRTAVHGQIMTINAGEVTAGLFSADRAWAFTHWRCGTANKCFGVLAAADSSHS